MIGPVARRGGAPLIEVRDSPVHGLGVFALRRIRKGTRVIEYLGERVPHKEADRRYDLKPADDNHTFLFIVDSRTVIDAGVGGNAARFINHTCAPNCESVTQNRRVFIEAIRTIEKGEELAYDYQIEWDPSDPPNIDEIFACRCGAPDCRGTMLWPPPGERRKKKSKKPAGRRAGAGGTGRQKSSRRRARKGGRRSPPRRAARR
ncbi:MAG: SET domain-containing protein-lysine N-methyltransferase [Proteobacteria bacterium]|nr:SET domain-containing protein-lysine N-methyltransferase [Pseudomonadota bacterium]